MKACRKRGHHKFRSRKNQLGLGLTNFSLCCIIRAVSQSSKRMTAISPYPISLRPFQADDEAFLFRLYCDTRAKEMADWGWNDSQQQAFLSMQFRARNLAYSTYPNIKHSIILNSDQPIGRLLVSRKDDELRLVDIALLGEACGQGIGAKLISDLFELAVRESKPVRLHVEKSNPAFRLYQRLGFQILENTGTQFFMEWRG